MRNGYFGWVEIIALEYFINSIVATIGICTHRYESCENVKSIENYYEQRLNSFSLRLHYAAD